mgnify:CR=1 FL=1
MPISPFVAAEAALYLGLSLTYQTKPNITKTAHNTVQNQTTKMAITMSIFKIEVTNFAW